MDPREIDVDELPRQPVAGVPLLGARENEWETAHIGGAAPVPVRSGKPSLSGVGG